jgi:hypothetical protein
MGSKAQAKASGAWAAQAKKNGGPVRNTVRCPVCYGMWNERSFPHHTNSCSGPRRKTVIKLGSGKVTPTRKMPSLRTVVALGISKTNILTFMVAQRIDADAQISKNSHWLNSQ